MSEPAALDLVACPGCGAQNLPDARFCNQCGISVRRDSVAQPERRRADAEQDDAALEDRPTFEPHGADPLIGVVIADRYKIVDLIGRGGMGVVYKVEHARIGKLMALKLLTGELSRDRNLVARFKREALMMSKLSHPNTVQVFDYGTAEGLTYLAMEYLHGETLARVIKNDGALSVGRTARIVIQICSSLAEAHEIGMVHRDLKPENILLLEGRAGNDVVKVLDFGLAKLRESHELGEVTTRGAIVGTPYYMSPEQVRGEAVDHRGDVYSLGALMYACLTGRPPFEAPTPMGVLTKHLTEEPPPPGQRFPELAIPPGVSRIVLCALAKDPARRYQSVRELQRALLDELRGQVGQSSAEQLLDTRAVRILAGADSIAVTRDEVEQYERKLKRRGRYAWSALAVGLAAGALVGWRLWARASQPPPFAGVEIERNDSASSAQPLPFGAEVEGKIGERLDATTGDRDFFRVEVPAGTRLASVETAGLPNMPLCTSLYRVGSESPLGRWCPGGAGQGLIVPQVSIEPGPHYVAVMQDRDPGSDGNVPPLLENVSDRYRLRVAAATAEGGVEIEPNDELARATQVERGASARGALQWLRDVDVVCARPGPGRVILEVQDAPRKPRPRQAALEVTPVGGPLDGVPVRLHRSLAGIDASPRDAALPWRSPAVDAAAGSACVKLTLVPNPWSTLPHPAVAPASDDEWSVRVSEPQ
jgi:serine/threonine-protein kinase